MATSRETSTLYYVDSGTIWSVPANEDGQPRKIHSGDGVAITADGEGLIIQLVENQGVRWVRTRLDGRIVLPISVRDSWFWVPAVFNPDTGEVQRIPLPFQADPPTPAWTSDGKIIAVTFGLNSSLWRFLPAGAVDK